MVRPTEGRRLVAFSAAGLAAAALGGVLLQVADRSPERGDASTLTAADLTRDEQHEASRGRARTAPSAEQSPLPASAAPAPPLATPPSTPPPPSTPLPPVTGLDRIQLTNAGIIVQVGLDRALPARALVVAVATALQESNLYNVASSAVPESLKHAHQGVAVNYDSVGLFQQRPSQGWGSVAQLMDPRHSAGLFLDRLVKVAGWQSMSVTSAAQAVQRSAYPNAYQKHQGRSEEIVEALT